MVNVSLASELRMIVDSENSQSVCTVAITQFTMIYIVALKSRTPVIFSNNFNKYWSGSF